MKKSILTVVLLFAALCCYAVDADVQAADTVVIETTRTIIINAASDTMVAVEQRIISGTEADAVLRNIGSQKVEENKKEHISVPVKFAWGADVGASIDMTGQDMSGLEISASFGLRRGWLNFVGVGAGADIMTSNSARSYPMFVDFRTNFVNRRTLFFWSLRGGVSLSYLEHSHRQLGPYGSTGLGVNLARGKSFASFLYMGYTYRHRNRIVGELVHDFKPLHYATFKIGVTF